MRPTSYQGLLLLAFAQLAGLFCPRSFAQEDPEATATHVLFGLPDGHLAMVRCSTTEVSSFRTKPNRGAWTKGIKHLASARKAVFYVSEMSWSKVGVADIDDLSVIYLDPERAGLPRHFHKVYLLPREGSHSIRVLLAALSPQGVDDHNINTYYETKTWADFNLAGELECSGAPEPPDGAVRIGDPESTTSHAMKLRDYPSATTYLKQHGLLPADAEDTSVRLVDGARIVYVNDGEILVAERRGTGPVILAKASTEIGERNPWLLRPDSVELIFASASETATAGNEADPEGAVVQARPVEDASDGQTADRPTLPQEAQAPPPTAATAWAHVVVCVAASLAVAAAALLLRRRRRSP